MIVNDINIFINYSYLFDSLDSSPLLSKKETLSRDCEHDETPRWASQRYNHSLFQTVGSPSNSGTTCSNTNNQLLVSKPFLTAYNKNFTSPSLRYVHFLSCQSLLKKYPLDLFLQTSCLWQILALIWLETLISLNSSISEQTSLHMCQMMTKSSLWKGESPNQK